MKKSIVLVFIGMLYSINLFALSPEIKFDILKTKLTKQLKAQEYPKALDTMGEIRSLGVKVPKSFEYFEGKALFESGKKAESYSKFEKYINATGKKGKYYNQALEYLIEAEEAKVKKEEENKVPRARKLLEKYTDIPTYSVDGEEDEYKKRTWTVYKPELTIDECSISGNHKSILRKYSKKSGTYSSKEFMEGINIPLVIVEKVELMTDRIAVSFYKGMTPKGTGLLGEILPITKKIIAGTKREDLVAAIFTLKEAAIAHGCKN